MPSSRMRKDKLTELEGTILAAVRRAGSITAYRLRQAFLASPSMEWSGSAGAVYPAMRRLKAAGLLAARATDDGRGTEHYSLTKRGERAAGRWAGDVKRAVSAGTDPFRSRAPEWAILTPRQRARLMRTIAKAINARCRDLDAKIAKVGKIGREQLALERDLQRTRLRWIAAHK